MTKNIFCFLVFSFYLFLFGALILQADNKTWCYALDGSGNLCGYKGKHSGSVSTEFAGATTCYDSTEHPEDIEISLGAKAQDEYNVFQWKYVDSAWDTRNVTERSPQREVFLKPLRRAAYDDWQTAISMDAVDDSLYTTGELDALEQIYTDLKNTQ